MKNCTGMVPVRKAGKLPWEVERESYALEYGTDLLEIHLDAVHPGDRVLVVDCPVELQRARLARRDGSDAAEIEAILAAQATRAQRLAIADDVITNDGDLASLPPRVAALHAQYLRLAVYEPGGRQAK